MSDMEHLGARLADRYRLERELGAGGMATVYRAKDVAHDRNVALKVLRPELAAILGAERFLAEIKTTADPRHPDILACTTGANRRPGVLRDADRRGETLRERTRYGAGRSSSAIRPSACATRSREPRTANPAGRSRPGTA
jgi:hypothetical protein